MSIRNANGESVDGAVGKIADVPNTPTSVSAADVGTARAYNNGAATVSFTPDTTYWPATSFTATSSPDSLTATGAASPLTITGLTSAQAYTFSITGTNGFTTSPAATTSSVTATTVPQAPTIGTFTDGGTGTTGTLSFTAGATGGSTITGYTYSTDGTNYSAASGTTSPLSLTGLTAGTYTFYLKATNANGTSLASTGVSGTVIQPPAFYSIATATLSGVTTTTFSSIPGTYKSLQLRFNVISASSGDSIALCFNGDTATNYVRHSIYGNNSNIVAGGLTARPQITMFGVYAGTPASTYPNVGITDIIDYASTSKNKVVKTLSGADSNSATVSEIDVISGLWLNTAAITSITVFTSSNMNSGTTIALYGIN